MLPTKAKGRCVRKPWVAERVATTKQAEGRPTATHRNADSMAGSLKASKASQWDAAKSATPNTTDVPTVKARPKRIVPRSAAGSSSARWMAT